MAPCLCYVRSIHGSEDTKNGAYTGHRSEGVDIFDGKN